MKPKGKRWLLLTSDIGPLISLSDPLIHSCQHIGRNREADLFCRFQIDHQLELRWLLNWNFGGLGTLQDFVNHGSNAPVRLKLIGTIGHKPAALGEVSPGID